MADTNRPLRVLIAGAGIGGLATAIALTRISGIQDLDIQIYEQAPELREIGASIALSPNVFYLLTPCLEALTAGSVLGNANFGAAWHLRSP